VGHRIAAWSTIGSAETETAASGRVDAAGEREGAYADALLHLAALSIVAGGIHAVAAAPHLAEWWPFGVCFCVLAAVQLGWGASIYARPSSLGFRAGVAINLGVLAIWAASRTVGLPLGPDSGRAESVGAPDLAAIFTEALIVALCGAFLTTAGGAASAALPRRYRFLGPLAMAAMIGGLAVLVLGGGHAHG
jgi:hypothetical protein